MLLWQVLIVLCCFVFICVLFFFKQMDRLRFLEGKEQTKLC